MKNKIISTVMGMHNSEKTLARSIESIINQTYTNWELIMCDDGSTDGTYEIAASYVSRYPDKMVLLHDNKNYQLAHALNKCLEVAKGDYIARMDADDFSMPDRFEKQLCFLNEHPEYIVCGTRIQTVNELSGKTAISKNEDIPDKYTMHHLTPFNHATILCRREMYDILGGYSDIKTTVRCEDKDLWFRFFSRNLKGANLNEALYQVQINKALIYRSTPKSRWNGFVTSVRGYKLLGYPWYWYWKPIINLLKILIPRKLLVLYYYCS